MNGTRLRFWLGFIFGRSQALVIDGAIQGATESHGNGGTIVLNPSTSSDVTTEVLRGTLNIPPTIDKAQGDRIEILVARDVDFRSVYATVLERWLGRSSAALLRGSFTQLPVLG